MNADEFFEMVFDLVDQAVFGFIVGSGKRLIATVETDIQAENVYRQWKGLSSAQKIEWVRSMQVKKEVAA